jgi:hypothetical protein
MPPRTNVAGPAALPSNADWMMRPRLVPADHGPAKAPKIPRAATAARRSSVSKNSDTRSATAIGPQRSSRNASRRGSPRNLRPTPKSSHSSPNDGSSIEGGVIETSGPSTPPMRPRLSWNVIHPAASFFETGSSSRAVRAGSP